MRYYGLKMVSCKLVTGLTQTPLSGAYLPLLTLDQLPDLEEALKRFRDPIVLGDLNVDLNKSKSLRIQRVEDLLMECNIIDLVRHFRQYRRFRNLKTWSQVRQETVLQLSCDYILGTGRCRFNLVGICDMRNFFSDHFALRERLLRRPTCCHARRLRGRIAFPLRLPPSRNLAGLTLSFRPSIVPLG